MWQKIICRYYFLASIATYQYFRLKKLAVELQSVSIGVNLSPDRIYSNGDVTASIFLSFNNQQVITRYCYNHCGGDWGQYFENVQQYYVFV